MTFPFNEGSINWQKQKQKKKKKTHHEIQECSIIFLYMHQIHHYLSADDKHINKTNMKKKIETALQ